MGSKRRKVLDTLTSTMKIDPDEFSHVTSPTRTASLGYAIAGWLYMLRHQKNTRLQSVASVAVMILAVWLQVSAVELAILILTITIVWMAEFINAAVEAVINIISPDYHPMAKVGKDVASAAVLLGVVASVIIGILLLGPPLLAKIGA